MPVDSEEAMLLVLRIKGQATPGLLAEALDRPAGEISAALVELAGHGLVRDSGKPRLGWLITSAGKQVVNDRIGEISDPHRAFIEREYERFRKVNGELKQLCTDWQTRDTTTASEASDFHARLAPIDEGAQRILAEITPVAEHFAGYGPRLARARVKFESGLDSHLTGIGVDSYHNIWFECHECFFLTLGRSRHQEESSSRDSKPKP